MISSGSVPTCCAISAASSGLAIYTFILCYPASLSLTAFPWLHKIIAAPTLHNEKPTITATAINQLVGDASGNFTMFPRMQRDRFGAFYFEIKLAA